MKKKSPQSPPPPPVPQPEQDIAHRRQQLAEDLGWLLARAWLRHHAAADPTPPQGGRAPHPQYAADNAAKSTRRPAGGAPS